MRVKMSLYRGHPLNGGYNKGELIVWPNNPKYDGWVEIRVDRVLALELHEAARTCAEFPGLGLAQVRFNLEPRLVEWSDEWGDSYPVHDGYIVVTEKCWWLEFYGHQTDWQVYTTGMSTDLFV